MPECHSCEWNNKGTRHCLTCRGPAETNHKHRVFVSIDALRGNEAEILRGAVESDDDKMAAFVSLTQAWLKLDRTTSRIVSARLSDRTAPLRIIAKRCRISTQAAHARLKRAREQWPALEDAIPMKLLKDGLRKAARR